MKIIGKLLENFLIHSKCRPGKPYHGALDI